ncbi:phosphotransferase [Phycicoccus sp. CSK15P-2]|uniref:phosphotransferase enzyme family protein n=1 Tax=Phycicoccus sp. CSK15P-2 TaxID=2807627 RepID=UPI00194FD8C7|nr:phosphotransferase [Phycicoccus sp. CSK15P-2]MBM6403930.1 phosphotransferase [Phycicoccus sp. CSK15P-2]
MTAHDAATRYEDLDEQAQVDALRRVALEAAPRFGLEVARLELVLHGFNTTFEVATSDSRRVALRVNVNSLSDDTHLAAQLAWVHALARDTDVRVPDPVPTRHGEPFTIVRSAVPERDFRVVVNTWLDGEDVGDCDLDQASALGRAMATLHVHASTWSPPSGTSLPVFDEPLCGDEDRLSSSELLDDSGSQVVAETFERTRQAFAADVATTTPVVVHGDLHGGNLKWHEGRLAVFDFDDAGLATPALDLAVATYYLRGDPPEVETALRAGYGEVVEWPDVPPERFETLIASRQLILANSLLTTSTPEYRAMAPEYLARTVERLRHWLTTGRFVLDPPAA